MQVLRLAMAHFMRPFSLRMTSDIRSLGVTAVFLLRTLETEP
jgi:hypothetical protein